MNRMLWQSEIKLRVDQVSGSPISISRNAVAINMLQAPNCPLTRAGLPLPHVFCQQQLVKLLIVPEQAG